MLNKTFKTNPSFLRTLLLLFFMTITLNAANYKGCDFLTKEEEQRIKEKGSNLPYKTKLECLEWENREVNARLDSYSINIMNSPNLPQANRTVIKRNELNWSIQRDKLCDKHKKNRTKYLTCFIGETIPKAEEFKKLYIALNTNAFEGWWTTGGTGTYDGDKYFSVDLEDWFIEENGNICGQIEEMISDFRRRQLHVLFRSKDNHTAHAIKMCDYCENKDCVPCYKENGEAIGFSEWRAAYAENTDAKFFDYDRDADIYMYDASNCRLRYTFKPGEREELIKQNKWLQDCLNYKGE